MTETTIRPFTASSFKRFVNEEKLVGTRCIDCAAVYIPPRAICPHCHSNNLEWTELSGKGRIAAFTSIYIAPTFMIEQGYGREAPYLTGIVTLNEGPRISARIFGLDPTNPQENWIGIPVLAEFLKHGEGEEKKTELVFRAI
jgi:uncharacterized protein